MAFGLFSACVDPDELLRLFRRVSYRSALTAALATRLVPVLARDACRMGDAARCRPEPPGRLAVARAALAGALDRAVDVAAALEVRGYARAGRPARAAAALVAPRPARWPRRPPARRAGAVAGALAGVGPVEPYPTLEMPLGRRSSRSASPSPLLAAALPFAGRAARLGVARG